MKFIPSVEIVHDVSRTPRIAITHLHLDLQPDENLESRQEYVVTMD